MEQQTERNANNRTVTVRVRVTLSEKQKLIQQAEDSGVSISDWLRLKTVGSKPLMRKQTPENELLLKFLAAFGRCSSNLNQLQRMLNRKQYSDEFEMPLASIHHLLNDMKIITGQLRDTFNHGHKGTN